MAENRNAIRNGLICCLIFAACYWVAWPIAEMGFDDDWSYIKSAQVFAQTGHFVYNGWAAAMLGWQIPWGALFIRILGFSFTAVKLSMFPIAIATLLLFHTIQTRFGIKSRNAIIGTLTLGLSPMFMPLAASYMTDVSGLFIVLLCLYCCQRAVAATSDRKTIQWLCLAAVSSVAGGTVRQIAWLGTLVMVPSGGWLLRKKQGVLVTVAILWVASTGCVLYCMHWFATRPYSLSATTFPGPRPAPADLIVIITVEMVAEILCLLLMVYPVLVGWLVQIPRLHRFTIGLLTFILLVCTYMQWSLSLTLPWAGNLIRTEFTRSRVADWRTTDRFMLGVPESLIFAALIIVPFLVFLATARRETQERKDASRDTLPREVHFLLAPFILSYFVLLLPHASDGMAFDRYMLGLMPFAIIYFILLYQEWVNPRLPAVSVVTLALYAFLAVAGTHDWFASQRARLAAISEIRASGVPRNEIGGGFEYDSWTQIEDGGYINSPLLKVPSGAYRLDPGPQRVIKGCALDSIVLPDVHARYFVSFAQKPCLDPSKFSPVSFRAWLPPFHGTLYVQQVPAAVQQQAPANREPAISPGTH